MGLLYTLSGTLSENQDFIKVSEYHCDDFIVMTVLWFFELGRGVWNAFRGHTQRGLNHAQPTIQLIDSISIVPNSGAKINKNPDKHKYCRSDTDSRLRTPKHLGRVEGTQEHKDLCASL